MYVLPETLYSTDGTFDDSVLPPGPLPLIMSFQPPRWTRKVPPNYPDQALGEDDQGDVSVAVTIDATGKTNDITVVTSSGHSSLDGAAVDAARVSGFGPPVMPAALGGKPTSMRFVIDYTFTME
jgi:TonB family protein